MAETSQTVLIEHPEPGVAVLRLNRPQRSNASHALRTADSRFDASSPVSRWPSKYRREAIVRCCWSSIAPSSC